MDELTLEQVVDKAERLKILMASQGWADVLGTIFDMRQEAFETWSGLGTEFKPTEAYLLKAKDQVLKDFLSRLADVVRAGEEARERIAERDDSFKESQALDAEQAERNMELERLMIPISAITPGGAAEQRSTEPAHSG